jgi:predicted SnoaL-like aldol condensation-catalyzing enzyme
MRFRKFIQAGLAVALVLTLSSIAKAQSAQEKKNQEMVMSWYHDVVLSGHVNEAAKYMADDYIEHDPRISGGRAGFIQHYENPSARPADAKLISSLAQGDYVMLAWERADKDPKTSTPYTYTTYDLVRVKNGKIQEHWDNAKKDTQWR